MGRGYATSTTCEATAEAMESCFDQIGAARHQADTSQIREFSVAPG
jgi:hypothetical protein